MSEDRQDYLSSAAEMLGKGYEPAATIESPRSVYERRAGKMQEVEKPAFIKLSTAFKSELENISGDALKVWIFVSLSINRKTGKANPGLRTISKGVKLAVNTVQKCLKELEEADLLIIDRESMHYNQYETPEYVSANRLEPTVSNRDTPPETVSNRDTLVSNFGGTVSPSVILNQSNQIKPDMVDFELSKLPAISIRKAVFEYFRINTDWDTKYNRQWMEWAMENKITAEQIRQAASTWRADRQFNWQAPTLKGIFEKWQLLMDAGKVTPSPVQPEGKGFYA